MWVFDPLGSPCIGLPPTLMQLIVKKYLNVYLRLLCIIKWSKREVIWRIPLFGSFFCQSVGIWPPGVSMYRVTPTVMQLILKEYHHALSWMYICGYSALSNSPNRESLWIIPILGVIFGQNMGIGPPGVPIYWVTPCGFPLILNK